MKIFNRKLAKRIKENDELLSRLTYRLVTCNMDEYRNVQHEMFVARRRIIMDESTLRQAGYDRKGNKYDEHGRLKQAKDWEARVRKLEDEGLTRSDAQAVVDAEDMKKREKPNGKP